jgi:outer membrane protein, multidrug efflux system
MHKISVWSIFLATLVGCQAGPRYQLPITEMPCEWHSPASEGMQEESAECFVWWQALNDPILTCLLQRAAEQNLDLSLAGTRILEARAQWKGKSGDLYPRLDASATIGYFHGGKELVKEVFNPNCLRKSETNFFEIGFDAEWEIDLFGKTAYEIRAAKANLEAIEESYYNVWVTLSAEIARNYVELRGLQQRLRVLEQNIEFQKESIGLIEDLLNIGMVGEIDLKQAQGLLNELEAKKPLLELSVYKAIHRLSILLGYAPGELFNELTEPRELPLLPCDRPIGIPSELFQRRPDIRKAERELAAATEKVGSAIASLFPRISLKGFVGEVSTQLHSLCDPSNTTILAGSQILAPIFNSKMLMQDVNYSKIKTRQALYTYQKTVLEALEEAENAIASFHYELKRNEQLAQALQTHQEAYQLTMQLYQKGFKSYIDVLVSYRSVLAAQDTYIQGQANLLLHFISLYKALGGGWDISQCLGCECED